MRIAYLVNQYPHTSHSFIRREIHGLEQEGHQISRFSLRAAGPLPDPADEEERAQTRSIVAQGAARLLLGALATALAHPWRFGRAFVKAVKMGWRSDRGLLLHFAYLVEACTLLRWTGEVDWIHAHFGTNSATVAALCRELGGQPFSFTVHGPEEFDKPEFLALREKIAAAEFVIAVSEFGRAQLFRWARFEDWGKVRVVGCGVADEFQGVPYQPPEAPDLLVCVARLGEQKGHLVLIEAAARLAERGVSFGLELIGDGPMRGAVEASIAAHGLGDRVQIAGWMSGSEVRKEILRARCLVLASFAEGLPVVLMEALALGRPVIATAVAGVPELVEPGVNGWLVPAGSVPALTDAMELALKASPQTQREMGLAGAARVAATHDARAQAALLARFIADAISRGRAPAEGNRSERPGRSG